MSARFITQMKLEQICRNWHGDSDDLEKQTKHEQEKITKKMRELKRR